MATSIKNFFTPQEAADHLGLTKSIICRYIREGRIETEIVGKRSYLIPRKAVEAFRKVPRKRGPKPRLAS